MRPLLIALLLQPLHSRITPVYHSKTPPPITTAALSPPQPARAPTIVTLPRTQHARIGIGIPIPYIRRQTRLQRWVLGRSENKYLALSQCTSCAHRARTTTSWLWWYEKRFLSLSTYLSSRLLLSARNGWYTVSALNSKLGRAREDLDRRAGPRGAVLLEKVKYLVIPLVVVVVVVSIRGMLFYVDACRIDGEIRG